MDLQQRLLGPPAWFGPAMAAAIGPTAARLQNLIARTNNSAANGIFGRCLIPLENQAGIPPPDGAFPPLVDDLMEWELATRRVPAAWNRLHQLLQFYGIGNPTAGGAVFVPPAPAPLPPCPTIANGYRPQMQARAAALKAFITL